MHIVVSWDITGEANERRDYWDSELRNVLAPYAWVRPLTTFFVVPVADAYQRQIIIDNITNVSQRAGSLIHFVVSPLMVGGQYQGVLPQHLWAELNKRTA